MPTIKRVVRANYTLLDINWFPDFLAAHRLAAGIVLDTGAVQLQRAAKEVIATEGGQEGWPENSDITRDWKGHDQVMRGRTGTMADSIDVKKADLEGPGNLSIPYQRLVGFFDEPHPDSQTGASVAEVAMAHEFGLAYEENIPGHGSGGSRPGLGMAGIDFPMDIPSRPLLSRAADTEGPAVLARMDALYLALVRHSLGPAAIP